VSMPSVREALRILEAEGLIVMRRGATPGALVRLPRGDSVAYMLGLTLSAQGTTVAELGEAIERLEPVCAALCAERDDRHDTVIPMLEQLQRDAEAVQRDEVAFAHQARRFHDGIIAGADNRAILIVLGSLEALWQSHLRRVIIELQTDDTRGPVTFTPGQSLADHRALIDSIADGDPAAAEDLAKRHVRSVFCDALPLTVRTEAGAGVVRPDLLKATGPAAR
jgi:GntR family transcriptional repressor for pyruvate dehydrogenase complex